MDHATSQQRLRRFIRQPDRLTERQLTPKGLEGMAIIERYRFIPSSLLVRLMPGGQRNNFRHLQTLFHKGYVQRFALPKYGGPGEFIYYLDSRDSLDLLFDRGLIHVDDEERARKQEVIRYNREREYTDLHREPDNQGKVLYIQHELMISRFHALLELGCRHPKFAGTVELDQWKQGPELWSKVEVPAVAKQGKIWTEKRELEQLPHRPDAAFTLYFPKKTEGEQYQSFFYEADRGTENSNRFKLKLRAHYHFIVKQQRQRKEPYNVHSIRAVLIESTDKNWASKLRESAKHPVVSPRPSPLFWFTTSALFFDQPKSEGQSPTPRYLDHPEVVFGKIWASPVEDKLLHLGE